MVEVIGLLLRFWRRFNVYIRILFNKHSAVSTKDPNKNLWYLQEKEIYVDTLKACPDMISGILRFD